MDVRQLVEGEMTGEAEVLGENQPIATLFTTNPRSPDLGSNKGPRGGQPWTNRLARTSLKGYDGLDTQSE
jgi:hypothetical protein